MNKGILQKQMRQAFSKELKGAVKEVTFTRDLPSDTIPNTTEPYYDPVTETWIHPDPLVTTNPNHIEEHFKGVFRKVKTAIADRYSLSNTDKQLTIDYEDFYTKVQSPAIDDRISSPEGDFRVVGWDMDSMNIFVTLYLRRNP